MSHGPLSVYTATMATNTTLTSSADLSRAWKTVYLQVPTMTSGTQLHIQASDTLAGTYRRVYHPPINSSTVGVNAFAIASSATNCLVPIPNGLRYIKVEATAVVSFDCAFKIICSD